MGVKSTVILTRAGAESRWVDHMLTMNRLALEHEAGTLSNTVLEDSLEHLNDLAHGGEGFKNYLIEEPKP